MQSGCIRVVNYVVRVLGMDLLAKISLYIKALQDI